MRVFLIVLDSVGAGELPDAAAYGDAGANTLKHVIEKENPKLPNLGRMGLGFIDTIPYARPANAAGAAGRALEKSPGKDTTTGHWEMAGIRLQKPFPTYPNGFPPEVIAAFERAIGRKTLGNYAASGTAIIEDLGEEHLRTGSPIVYTSADSVFQIACNEEIIPLKTLYEWCEIARKIMTGEHNVGRVIARPFVGRHKGGFTRTKGRRDFSVVPPEPTILDVLLGAGFFTMGVGKIEDIFAEKGLKESVHSAGNAACIDQWLTMMRRDFHGLTFVNLVDFDMLYGHRRDTKAYAEALEEFDEKLGLAQAIAREDDVFIITADHGCDPTYRGTDHTREHAPILVWTKKMRGFTPLGTRETFADIAATIADLFGLPQRFNATSFADSIRQEERNMTYLEKIDQAAAYIQEKCGAAGIAVVLGSGLGDYAERLENAVTIPYAEIPNFPVSTAEGHAGNWHAGTLHGKRVYLMQGRFHAYEGYGMEEVTMPIRVMARLGVQTLIVTNAAGGVNLSFPQGCLMLIDDFINLSGRNPLIGPNLKEFGPRFPDMTYALDPALKTLARETAKKLNIPLQQGVYCWLTGPSYETPAEIRAFRTLGADAVGMSTVPEIIVGRHSGIKVMGISCITNMAAGILDRELDMYEVIEAGKRVKHIFAALVDGIIENLS